MTSRVAGSRSPGTMTRRSFLAGAAAVAAVSAYSYGPGRHHLTVLRHDVYIPDLPSSFEGFKIAQLSDFHFGKWSEDSVTQHAVQIVNSLAPDIVALTGDFITANHEKFSGNALAAEHCCEILDGIKAPRFASFGNHDSVDVTNITRVVRSHKIGLLHNEFTALDLRGDRLWLSGIADVLEDTPDLKAALPAATAGQPVVLLGHEPDFVDVINDYCHRNQRRADLMLAGHTHGGQINIPGLLQFALPQGGMKYVHGPFQVAKTTLYVNRGLGTIHLPMRWNAPPEVTLLTLHS